MNASSTASDDDGAVVHATQVFERRFDAAPALVFAAWADAKQRAKWHFPGKDQFQRLGFEQDFRVGGQLRSSFGAAQGPVLREEGWFLDIVDARRIVSAGTMHADEARISSTLCTVELWPNGRGTRVKLTDQSAFLAGRETPSDRKAGWGEVMERLEQFLRARHGASKGA
ncbi:SRPBCC domain-containing protein [Variovorax sp. KK3]|uniref:SRPBCC domain-containing protein n=1 Tax=Variovorax sp. KK3 TaxID=1855728 RepID=UPI00097C273F|nr:SRPBCC domain-containing protein [Variovorax sp. KK3]